MKDKNLHVRMTKSDYETIREKAYGSYLTISNYITMCALGKQIYVVEGLDEVIRQQKRIGNNLNQLTHLAHEGKVDTVGLQELKAEYEKMNQILSDLLERKRWR